MLTMSHLTLTLLAECLLTNTRVSHVRSMFILKHGVDNPWPYHAFAAKQFDSLSKNFQYLETLLCLL